MARVFQLGAIGGQHLAKSDVDRGAGALEGAAQRLHARLALGQAERQVEHDELLQRVDHSHQQRCDLALQCERARGGSTQIREAALLVCVLAIQPCVVDAEALDLPGDAGVLIEQLARFGGEAVDLGL